MIETGMSHCHKLILSLFRAYFNRILAKTIEHRNYSKFNVDVLLHELDQEHCVKSVPIWSFSGPHFPAFGLNTERYLVSLRIQSECGKIQTRITPIRSGTIEGDIYNSEDSEYDLFSEFFRTILDHHVPLKTKRIEIIKLNS